MNRNRSSLLATCAAAAAVFWGCAAITGPGDLQDKVFTVGEEFTLQIGQTARTRDSSLVVQFTDVAESRCPPDVTCVWEGFAKATLGVGMPSLELQSDLSTNASVCCTADTLGTFIFSLIQLDPVPRSNETEPPYVARLLVTPAE